MRVLKVWLVVLAIGAAGLVRAEPAPRTAAKAPAQAPVGATQIFAALTQPDHPAEMDALRALRDALSGSPDPQRLAAARSQLELVLQAEERHQVDMPPALVMSGIASRIDTAIAGLEAARRLPAPEPREKLPSFLVPGLAALSAALGAALVACLAGLAARGRQAEDAEDLRETLKKIRRRLEGAGLAPSPSGGLAQELAEVASGEASEAVRQAANAVDRLGAAARDAEGRLDGSVSAAEVRLHAAANMAGQLEKWVEALPDRLAETVQAMEARGLAAVEEAAARLEAGVAPLAEIGFLLADYAGAASGLTAQAEEAALDVHALAKGLEERLDAVAGALPDLIAATLQPVLGELTGGADLLGELSNLAIGQAAKLDDIIARADKVACELPAVGQVLEAASSHLMQQIRQDAASAAAVNEAAEALGHLSAEAVTISQTLPARLNEAAGAFEARMVRESESVQTHFEAGSGVAGDSLSSRLDGVAAALEARLSEGTDAMQARLVANAQTVSEGLAGRLGEVAEALEARLSNGADAVRAQIVADATTLSESLAGRIAEVADTVSARLAGRAELFQAGLESGTAAIVDAASALPAIRDGLREVAVHLARETSNQAGTLSQLAKTLGAETVALLSAARPRPEEDLPEGPQTTAGVTHLHALAERLGDLAGQLQEILLVAQTTQSERSYAEEGVRAQEADQMASLLDALAGRAEACLSALPAEAAALAATAAQLRGDAVELSAVAERIADAAGSPGSLPADIAGALGALLESRQILEENFASLGETRAALSDQVSALGHETRHMQHGAATAQAGFSASAREAEAAIRTAVETLGLAIARLPAQLPVAISQPDPTVRQVQALVEVLTERQAILLERVEQVAACLPVSGSGMDRESGAAEREIAPELAVQSERLAALLERVEAQSSRAPETEPLFVAVNPMAQEMEARLAGLAERIAGLLERNERLAERLAEAAEATNAQAPVQPAHPVIVPAAQIDSKGLEAATETVQRSVQRLLESAAAQEAALSRASLAASEVARLAEAPAFRAGVDRMGLAGLNGLASLAETLQGEAESLAASVLRGEAVRFPAELVSQTPVMLAAIETSIHRLRGTATALALASDAQQKAA